MTILKAIITPKRHMEIAQFLVDDKITTNNINVREKTIGDINFDKNPSRSFIKNQVKILLKGNKPS